MFPALYVSVALAAPPSSTLGGPDGTLDWQVRATAQGVTIDGRSPKWTVHHEASATLQPRRTVHTDPKVGEVVIDYTATGASLTRDGRVKTFTRAGLWDGDTVDIRLGVEVAAGRTALEFAVLDPASGKVYDLDSALVAREQCGDVPCTHVRTQLTGFYRPFGPTWHYWYGADGKLLRFEGPAGAFKAE